MPSDTVATRARRAPFRWELGTVYVDFLVALSDHVKREKREDSSFTKTTWSEILVHISSKGHNVPNWDTLKTKHNTVKKLYREWVALCNASGFERDKETGAVTASDECWAAYLEKHPVAARWRYQPIVHEDLLDTIYADVRVMADTGGRTAIKVSAEDGEGLNAEEPEDEEMPLQTPAPTTSLVTLPSTSTSTSRSASPIQSQQARRRRPAEIPLSHEVYKQRRRGATTRPEIIREGIMALADSIISSRDGRGQLQGFGARADVKRISDSEEAQQRLIAEYPQLDPAAVVEMMDFLEDPVKARTFLILPNGPIRDAWLLKRLPDAIKDSAAASM
ncbi:hypothetical protein Egran_03734 [Elaphomyces granulatus]|uniref:Myb/SANT-like domain-containing protein n=1 Tax=Elaphomyces granulatus TaxID=519963 RepID=A0A232LWK8_9EURO|nr:hypothetical protein Egran_03734 [Elaphomyces granulatus]